MTFKGRIVYDKSHVIFIIIKMQGPFYANYAKS